MKKLLVSILAVFYLASSVGAVVHLHYCMDKLINWSLLKTDGDKCVECGMKKDGGCCKDEHKFVKNNVDQKTTEFSIQLTQELTVAPPRSDFNLSEFYISILHEYSISHAPPISGSEIYILNCVFRI